jgi:hypothetical protein
MKNKDYDQMKMEKQIKTYEDCISRLEECKRTGSGDPSTISKDLETAYQQITLLKIRQMMLNA